MNRLISSIAEMFAVQSLLRILVLWGIACIIPFMLLLQKVPTPDQQAAAIQMGVVFGVLHVFFARYIRVNKPTQEAE